MAEVLEITEDKTEHKAVAKVQTRRKIRTAARMRVAGDRWAVIGKHINRSETSARSLVVEYPELWRIAYDKALNSYRPKLEALAMNSVEDLLGETVRKPIVNDRGLVESYEMVATPLGIRTQNAQIALTHARQSRAQQVNVNAVVGVLDTTALVELARAGTTASAEQIRLAETGALPSPGTEKTDVEET